MQIKFFAALFSLALASTVYAAPVPQPIPALVSIEARSLALTFEFTGGLEDIKIPPASSKNFKKKTAQAAAKKSQQAAAQSRVQAVMEAAASALGLSGHLTVNIKNGIHQGHNKADGPHGTFVFDATVCNGECTGHFFDPTKLGSPGKGQIGQIFAKGGKTIFGENDIA